MSSLRIFAGINVRNFGRNWSIFFHWINLIACRNRPKRHLFDRNILYQGSTVFTKKLLTKVFNLNNICTTIWRHSLKFICLKKWKTSQNNIFSLHFFNVLLKALKYSKFSQIWVKWLKKIQKSKSFLLTYTMSDLP